MCRLCIVKLINIIVNRSSSLSQHCECGEKKRITFNYYQINTPTDYSPGLLLWSTVLKIFLILDEKLAQSEFINLTYACDFICG